MNFYETLHKALVSPDIQTKDHICSELLEYCSQNEKIDKTDTPPTVFERPSYSSFCTIVKPRDLPARKNFDTGEGLAVLVHAIAHIEFSAIDLAFDAVYRFRDMPMKYVQDWLIVAEDEIRHFYMLQNILEKLGFAYGDMPVHQGLFDASMNTAGDPLDRMAVIPRHYEATGLDVNPQIVKKLKNFKKNPIVTEIIEALELIETEEIDHVRKGDKWFRWLCDREGYIAEEKFKEVLDRYDLYRRRPHLNVEARKEAGFACKELLELGANECE